MWILAVMMSDALAAPVESIEQISLGAEPRRVLSISVPEGHTESVWMTVDLDIQGGLAGALVGKLPVWTMENRYDVVKQEPDGSRMVTQTILHVATDTGDTESSLFGGITSAALSEMVGMKTTYRYYPNGSTEFISMEGGNQDVQQAMKKNGGKPSPMGGEGQWDGRVLLAPKPVGVGASWRVKNHQETEDGWVDVDSVFLLTGIHGDAIDLMVTQSLRGESNAVTGERVVLVGNGAGALRWDLHRLASMGELTIRMSADASSGPMPMKFDMTVRTKISDKPPVKSP